MGGGGREERGEVLQGEFCLQMSEGMSDIYGLG